MTLKGGTQGPGFVSGWGVYVYVHVPVYVPVRSYRLVYSDRIQHGNPFAGGASRACLQWIRGNLRH